jgi:hypothetical protein
MPRLQIVARLEVWHFKNSAQNVSRCGCIAGARVFSAFTNDVHGSRCPLDTSPGQACMGASPNRRSLGSILGGCGCGCFLFLKMSNMVLFSGSQRLNDTLRCRASGRPRSGSHQYRVVHHSILLRRLQSRLPEASHQCLASKSQKQHCSQRT